MYRVQEDFYDMCIIYFICVQIEIVPITASCILLVTYKTRVCLGKTFITSIVGTEHIVHTLVESPGTARVCDIVKHKSLPQIMTIV